MPPATIFRDESNNEALSAILTQDPEKVAEEKRRVEAELMRHGIEAAQVIIEYQPDLNEEDMAFLNAYSILNHPDL